MKNLVLLAMLFVSMLTFGQRTSDTNNFDATRSGQAFVGANTSGLGFKTVNEVTQTAVALEAGKFIADDLALVGTVGYQSLNSEFYNANAWTYGAGLKYFILNKVPVQVDYNGATGNGYNPTAQYIGLQLGYAWMPFRNVSIEPRLRQNFSLDKSEYANELSGAVGVYLHF